MSTRVAMAVFAAVFAFSPFLIGCGDDDDDRTSFGGDTDDDDSGVPGDDDSASDDDTDDDDDVSDDDDSGYGLMLYRDAPFHYKKFEAAEALCEDLEFEGYDDWRLPTISELRTFIRGCPATETGGDCPVTDSCAESDCWFMDDCEACKFAANEGPGDEGGYWDLYSPLLPPSGVWSATEVEDEFESKSYWTVEFDDAGIHAMSDTYDLNTWCVRVGETPGDDDDGVTWTDDGTGLTWQVEPNEDNEEWEGAIDYCEGLGAGWRLPTISELRSIITICEATMTGGSCEVTDECTDPDECFSSDCFHGCESYGGQALGCYWPIDLRGDCYSNHDYWSATETAPSNLEAWFVDFSSAKIMRGPKEYLSPILTRCVRLAD